MMMKWWSAVALTGCVAAGVSMSAQEKPVAPLQGDPLVLRGCVVAGDRSGTYVMSNVVEVDAQGAEKPPARLINPILYWFKDASGLAPHVGRRVEVSGKIDGLEQTEAELKAGAQKDGSLVVELEGPGRDVVADVSALPRAAGTTGREPETDDVKATIIKVTMGHVTPTEGSCQ